MYKISHHFHILPSSNLQLIKHAFTWFYHNGCFCIHPLGVLITDTFNLNLKHFLSEKLSQTGQVHGLEEKFTGCFQRSIWNACQS